MAVNAPLCLLAKKKKLLILPQMNVNTRNYLKEQNKLSTDKLFLSMRALMPAIGHLIYTI